MSESTSELREMSPEQLDAVMNEASKVLFKLKVQAQTDRVDAPSEIKRNRRLIARIKTVVSERRIAAAKEAANSAPATA